MKVFMNFLHNSSPILALLVRSHDHKSHDSSGTTALCNNYEISNIAVVSLLCTIEEGSVNSITSSLASLSCEEELHILELHWPELDMKENESKEEWIYTLLQSLGNTVEQLLIGGGYFWLLFIT